MWNIVPKKPLILSAIIRNGVGITAIRYWRKTVRFRNMPMSNVRTGWRYIKGARRIMNGHAKKRTEIMCASARMVGSWTTRNFAVIHLYMDSVAMNVWIIRIRRMKFRPGITR